MPCVLHHAHCSLTVCVRSSTRQPCTLRLSIRGYNDCSCLDTASFGFGFTSTWHMSSNGGWVTVWTCIVRSLQLFVSVAWRDCLVLGDASQWEVVGDLYSRGLVTPPVDLAIANLIVFWQARPGPPGSWWAAGDSSGYSFATVCCTLNLSSRSWVRPYRCRFISC